MASAEFSSANLYVIPWMFSKIMGGSGLKLSSELAILNANYIASRLEDYYSLSFRGNHSFVAHECILDFRDLKSKTGLSVNDLAKRLIDYSFHAPTISWPVPETIMIEPTESESLIELDRFCEAMLLIGEEISEIENNIFLIRKNNGILVFFRENNELQIMEFAAFGGGKTPKENPIHVFIGRDKICGIFSLKADNVFV